MGFNPMRGLGGGIEPSVSRPGSSPTRTTQAPPTDQTLVDAAKQRPQGPQYFGFHNDASIQARLAQQGVAPNAVNLRIAQQMLRYGLPLSPNTISQIRQLWQALGAMSLVDLEALIALFATGLPAEQGNMQAMLQLLSGGPMSHLMARLTIALKQAPGQQPSSEQLKTLLQAFWKLGNGPEAFPQEMGQFKVLSERIKLQVNTLLTTKPSPELAIELMGLQQLFRAHEMLQRQPGQTIYVPFFQWREQQPMPGELLVQQDKDDCAQQAAKYTQLTLAVDTRNLGRITIDLTACRGHLGLRFEVQDANIQKIVESGLAPLRKRIGPRTGYQLANVQVLEVGQGRAISVLLPKRRDLRKLSRAIGVL